VHILPRRFQGDRFENANDDIYPAIEESEKDLPNHLRTLDIENIKVDADEDRQPRTLEEMEKETLWLKSFFTSP
jgi:bis(5'-adenosyl)-triphosphatase